MKLQNELASNRGARGSYGNSGGVSQDEYNRLKYELDETKKYLLQLQREKSANNLLGNDQSIDEEKVQRIIRDYLEEIERLKAENEDLRMMGSMGGGGSGGDARLQMRVSELESENGILKMKVSQLQKEIEAKKREINNLRMSGLGGSGFGGGADSEAIQALTQTNERLVQEVNRLQEQLRKADSSFTNNSLSMLSHSNALGKY